MSYIRPVVQLLALLLCAGVQAQPIPTSVHPVAPGVIHKEYTLPGPYTLDVLELTRGTPYLMLESFRPNGLVKTTLQASANDRPGHRVVGAINADFFSFETGWPVGNQVVRGTFALGLSSNRSHLAVDTAMRPFIDRLAFRGGVRAGGGATAALSGVNTARGAGSMVLYTTFKGNTTGTDASGVECSLEFLAPGLTAGDTVRARVTARSAGGNMSIPANGAVLSGGSGSPAAFLNGSVSVGDTVSVFLGFNRPLGGILEVLGGAGRFLMRGRYVTDSMSALEGISASFTDVRHPRTFFGFNADTSTLFLCTVDGRQSTSIGMTFGEMANFLLSIGATDAFNFDGGGSTTMVVRGAIVNSPSDPAGERSVANSLQVISTAPMGTLHRLEIQPRTASAYQGGTVQFSASGTDEYFNPMSLPPGTVWEADPSIGIMNSSGLFTARAANDSGWVRVRWNAVADSARVVVRLLQSLYPTPSTMVLLPGERVAMTIRALDSRGVIVSLPPGQLSYSAAGTALTIDGSGVASATDFGSGTVTVSLDTLHAYVPFSCSDRETTIVADPMRSILLWSMDRINCDTTQMSFSAGEAVPGRTALRIAYDVPVASNAAALLNCVQVFSGRMDSLFLRVYGNGNGDSLRLFLRDKDGEPFWIAASATVTAKDQWQTVGFTTSRAVGTTSLDYPVTVIGVRVTPGLSNAAGGRILGTIYLADLGAHYPTRVVTPQILFDFEAGITGWLTPATSNTAQVLGIDRTASTLIASTDRAYQGSYSGRWTFVDDAASTADWDIRMPRSADLGSILRGSYIGAWVYAQGETNTTLQLVVRGGDGNGAICAGPEFPVRHYGWKLIGSRLDEALFVPYLTSGKIMDTGNKFNGFRLRAANARVSGQTRVIYVDKLVTNALTVPTGFSTFSAEWTAPLARLHWSVNSEISVNRYVIERNAGSGFAPIGALQAAGNIDTTRGYEFVDTPSGGLTIYQYRIRQVTNDGAQEFSPVVSVNTAINTSGPEGTLPDRYELFQNYPNPFNPLTVIGYQLPVLSPVRLGVYDLLGREVAVLVDEQKPAGTHSATLDAGELASGTYVYRLQAGGFIQSRKMVVVK